MAIGDVVEHHQNIRITEDDSPFGFNHNFPCPTCRQRPAVMWDEGVFGPCDECREKRGYYLVRIKNRRWARWLLGLWEYWPRQGKLFCPVNRG